MINQEVYQRNPATLKLANQGVANVNDDKTSQALSVLRYELDTFVCDGQYEKGLEDILHNYLKCVEQVQQPGVWISGFYGSGKSHLVKMLRALWVNTEFPDKATARSIANLPQSIKDYLKEFDVQARRHGGVHAASGTLGSSASGSVRLALLRIVFKSVDLPEQFLDCQFCPAFNMGWETLEPPYERNPESNAWCESYGNIDNEGHSRGWKLAKHLDEILREIQDQITQLLKANWKKIHVVTDHGWLLLPDGLPKSDVPKSLTQTKWGRCAAIKPGAATKEHLYPWYWNPNQHFALADGISCFISGKEYDHGGISLQECLTLQLTVSPGTRASLIAPQITNKSWKGLRCNVTVDGLYEELCLDIRTQPANPSSSIVIDVKHLKNSGTTALIVENIDLEGTKAMIVLVDKKGELVAQTNTTIGVE